MSTDSFISYDYSYPFLWFLDASIPSILKLLHNIDEVVIKEQDKRMLKSLKGERLVFVSNHPSTKEPPITFYLSRYTYSRFHYMAGREVFDWMNGFVGQVIKRMGAYSVIAGISDRESLKATRAILTEPEGKLVLFPEGEPTGNENDTLLPFQPGATQLAFWGYEDALKKDPKADICFLTTCIKYRMSGSIHEIRKDVDKSLDRLEQYFDLSKKGKTLVHRMLSIGRCLVERAEEDLGLKPGPTWDFDYRVGNLRHHILDTVAEKVRIKKWDFNANAIEKLRKLLSTFEMVSVGVPDPKKELPTLRAAKWGRLYLQKVYDFISIKKEYLVSKPTPERIYEWIYRFENEVFGSFSQRPSSAFVNFAPVFKISEYYPEYKKNKKETVDKLTQRQRDEIQKMLNLEIEKSYLLYPEDYMF